MSVWNDMGAGMGMGWARVLPILLIVGNPLLVVALVRGLGGGAARPPGADEGRHRARGIPRRAICAR